MPYWAQPARMHRTSCARSVSFLARPIVLPADPDDPEDGDVIAEGLERVLRARTIRMTRTKLGLTQAEFAARFRVPVGSLRDWEQARAMAPDFALAHVRVIQQHPDLVARTLEVRNGAGGLNSDRNHAL
jgi:putative transcriptional regulator